MVNVELYNGDCLIEMNKIADESVDLIFVDLPYGQISCKWDKKIDLEKMWEHFMRVKKLRTPIFMTCSTKFGAELIASAPKKCPFRYDIVWVKTAPVGFLSARKMPMKKHEMMYVFYEKLPFYDLSSHTHKFKKTKKKNVAFDVNLKKDLYGRNHIEDAGKRGTFEPKLPTSVQEEDQNGNEEYKGRIHSGGLPGTTYGAERKKKLRRSKDQMEWDPKLPVSVQEEELDHNPYTIPKSCYGDNLKITTHYNGRNGSESAYNPPLPTSVQRGMDCGQCWDCSENPDCPALRDEFLERLFHPDIDDDYINEDDIPNSILNIKSEKGKHSTQKPVDLMKWVLKYYSKKNDVVLDNCMGSGSTGVACVAMDRQFIGIEMNEDIFEVACDRIL